MMIKVEDKNYIFYFDNHAYKEANYNRINEFFSLAKIIYNKKEGEFFKCRMTMLDLVEFYFQNNTQT